MATYPRFQILGRERDERKRREGSERRRIRDGRRKVSRGEDIAATAILKLSCYSEHLLIHSATNLSLSKNHISEDVSVNYYVAFSELISTIDIRSSGIATCM